MTVLIDMDGSAQFIPSNPNIESVEAKFLTQTEGIDSFEQCGVPREFWEPEPTMKDSGTLILNMSNIEEDVVVAAMKLALDGHRISGPDEGDK